jgi:mono/diheme cytochrome c family protein
MTVLAWAVHRSSATGGCSFRNASAIQPVLMVPPVLMLLHQHCASCHSSEAGDLSAIISID